MQLTKEHREALLNLLERTTQEAQRTNKMLSEAPDRPELADIESGLEIDDWFLGAQIQIIKKALINNEIDY